MSRTPSSSNPVHARFGEFELDQANAWLLRAGKPVVLAPTAFNLLCAMARQPGALLTKDALLDAVWGHQFVSESVLKTAISDLRTALGDNAREPRFIETVSRRGYRFIAAPSAAAAGPSPAAAPSAAAPGVGTTDHPSSFVGRADTMARLRAAWQRASSGQRAMVWVAGEPGIGKTTVIEHFVASLGDVLCVRGQCVEHYGAGEPYLPVLEALAELCRRDPALPALMRSVAPTWLLQLPWLGSAEERDALRREVAGVGFERMLREMGELLDRYTGERPLLLVTEDLHWSDRATVELIDHVARRRGRACLMWLASFRLAEVVALDHPLNSLRRELRLHRLCDEVVLDAFAETEVAACVAQRSPALARNEAFVRALHERTDGLPLFVSTVIDEVTAPAADDAGVEARLAQMAVPESLVWIIEHYLARLDDERRALLAAAAVCGADFRAGVVAAVLGRDEAAVASACDELVRQHFWLTAPRARDDWDAHDPRYAFRHSLVRQVLYERTPAATKVLLHREAGRVLERARSAGAAVAPSELAMHFDRARQPMAALRWYAEAAEAALRNFSPRACIELVARAQALLRQAPEGAERDALEITLATLHGVSAFRTFGVGNEARDAFQRAYTLLPRMPAHPIRACLLHGFGFLSSLRGEYARAIEVAERAETLAAGSDDPALVLAGCLVRAHAEHMQRHRREAWSPIERGLAVAAELDDRAVEGFAADPMVTLLGTRAIEHACRGLLRQCHADLERAKARAEQLRQPITRLVAAWYEALVEVRLGNAERVAAAAEAMRQLVDEHSRDVGQAAWRWFRGWAEARLGRPREGADLIREAYEQHLRLGMRAGSSEVLGYAAEALLLAGDAEAAQAELGQALQIAEELGEKVYLPQLLLLGAAIARERGHGTAAAECARRAVEEARAQDAAWLELASRADMVEHGDSTREDHRALAALIERLPEAAGTGLAARATALVRAGSASRRERSNR